MEQQTKKPTAPGSPRPIQPEQTSNNGTPENEAVGLPEPPSETARQELSRAQPPSEVVKQKDEARAFQAQDDAASVELEGDDEEPAEPRSFQRSSSPDILHRAKGTAYEKVGEAGNTKMHRFSLYETSTRFYLIGADVADTHFRVLKIDRTSPPGHLHIVEDDIVYDKRGMKLLLNAIDDGNKGVGGMKLKCSTWGVVGFIRFTEAYYMLLITKRTQVAMIGGHYVYQIDGTELVPLKGSNSRFYRDRNPEETRFLGILNNLDLSRNFYFSYSYDVTRTLQHNMVRERSALIDGTGKAKFDYNDMFVWNHYLLEPARDSLKSIFDWCLPVIHGFVDQSQLNIFGRPIYVTIIARRSRYFAGARFLKRGANDLGYVANDVETEQIVSDVAKTSFHAPGPRLFASPNYTSYVQHRGSIPLYWTQDSTATTPKPDIDLQVDPFYSAAALHFDNLFERYGSPLFALNLIKARERTPRESKLLHEYHNAVNYLNLSLPANHQIQYKAFDMSRASKTRGQDVIGTLETIAEGIMDQTGFFHNGDMDRDNPKVQNGVARTNCIDCLDRTNAAQFVIGKRALGRQLQALGVIAGDTVDYDSDAVNIFTHMFHDHGDTIAIQYGGSHLVNTMATYRKINQWQSHSRDMVESFKRYYHNSFLDAQRQEAYNLFLGNYIFTQGQPMLWDLVTDYYLHHADPRAWSSHHRRHYINWFTPSYLGRRSLPPIKEPDEDIVAKGVTAYDDYWLEYYRPYLISSFLRIFSFRMNSTLRYLPEKNVQPHDYDVSPFRARKPSQHEPESPGKKAPRKGVTIVDPHNAEDLARLPDHYTQPNYANGAGAHLPPNLTELSLARHSILRDASQFDTHPPTSRPATAVPPTPITETFKPTEPAGPDKSATSQWTLNQFHTNSLNPTVSGAEADEYDRYVSHPHNLPLVVSSAQVPPSEWGSHLDFVEYVNTGDAITSVTAGEVVGEDGLLAGTGGRTWEVSDEDLADYLGFLDVAENPLTVHEEDGEKKRYKRYRQWLRGKSLFKQSKVDPEYQAGEL